MQNSDQSSIRGSALLMGLFGLLLLVAMQSQLLVSRHPVQPLLFFISGIALLQPLFAFYAARWVGASSTPQTQSPLNFDTLKAQLFSHKYDVLWATGLSVMALFLGQGLRPLQAEASPLNSLWLAFSVAAVYCAGILLGGRWMALFSAGFLASSSWALALIKAEGPYSLVVLIASLYLVALIVLYRWRDNTAAMLTGLLLFAGIWTFPLFIFNGLLAVLVIIFVQTWGPRWRRVFSGGGPIVLGGLAVIIGIVVQGLRHDTYAPTLNNPQFSFFESFSTAVLMFNLTSDPNPVHGIVYRPVLVPLAAAAFLIGLMALAWRIYARRQWRDSLPLWALALALIPAALQLDPPVRYPDLQQAAGAVPVVMLIAGGGMACLCHAIIAKLDKLGVIVATVILLVMLILCFHEAHSHYQNAVMPLLMRLSGT